MKWPFVLRRTHEALDKQYAEALRILVHDHVRSVDALAARKTHVEVTRIKSMSVCVCAVKKHCCDECLAKLGVER